MVDLIRMIMFKKVLAANIGKTKVERKSSSLQPPVIRSDCLQLRPSNTERAGLIKVSNPYMKDTVNHLLNPSRRTAGQFARALMERLMPFYWRLSESYFLSYHQEEPTVSGRFDGQDFELKRIKIKDDYRYEFSRDDQQIFVLNSTNELEQFINGELFPGDNNISEEVRAFCRKLLKKIPRPKEGDIYQQIGDSIIQVKSFYRFSQRNPKIIYISTFRTGSSRDSRDFFEKGYILPENLFRAKKEPDMIVIDAGPNPEFWPQQFPAVSENGAGSRFLIIPGELNFQVELQRNLLTYRSSAPTATRLLQEHPRFAKAVLDNKLGGEILRASNLFVLEKAENSFWAMAKIFRQAMKKNKNFGKYAQGAIGYNFGVGIEEGALLFAITNMLEAKYQLASFMLVFFRCIYPNFLSLMDIRAAMKFETLTNAERKEMVERPRLDAEARKMQGKVTAYLAVSAAVLMLLYPGVFAATLGATTLAVPVVGFLYVLTEYLRDRGLSLEFENRFAIFKRTLGSEQEYQPHILKLKAFEQGIKTAMNVGGFLLGWGLSLIDSGIAIPVALIGAFGAIMTKAIYPIYARDYKQRITVNREPFPLDDYNLGLQLDNKVRLKVNQEIGYYQQRPRKWVMFDPEGLEIILDKPQSIQPKIRQIKKHWYSRHGGIWELSWPNGLKCKIEFSDSQEQELIWEESEEIKRGFFQAKTKPKDDEVK
jgi:hypothetical protein